MGLLGNLSAAQVVEQVVEARRWLAHYQQQQQQKEVGGWIQNDSNLTPSTSKQQQDRHHEHQQQQQQKGIGEDHASSRQQQQEQGEVGALENLFRIASSGSSTTDSTCRISEEVSTSGSSTSSGRSSSSSSRQPQKGRWPAAPPRISNIVFMGMGEPLHNMDAVMPALDILADTQGLALSRSKIIVSTVGLVPQIRELRASGKAKLAVSLHATTDEVRGDGGGGEGIRGRGNRAGGGGEGSYGWGCAGEGLKDEVRWPQMYHG
jgi:hypothetical protein